MIKKPIAGTFAAFLVASSVGGCSTATVQTAYGPMRQYCTQNNTASGAIIGTLIGAGLGAAIGGGRGAAIGAASGAALGGVSGAQADQQCRQLALQHMVEMAAAQQAAAQQAAAQQAAAGRTQARQQVAFEPMEYYSPGTKQRHKLTPLNSYTNPVTKETCTSFDEVSFDDSGGSVTGKGRACIGADGKPLPA